MLRNFLVALFLCVPSLCLAQECRPMAPLLQAAKKEGYHAVTLTAQQVHTFTVNYNADPPPSNVHFDAIGIIDDGHGSMLIVFQVGGCVVDIEPITQDALMHFLTVRPSI